MNKSEKLKGYFKKYPFMQNKHFCELIKVKQNTIKSFLYDDDNINHRNFKEATINRILPLIESLDFTLSGWVSQNCT